MHARIALAATFAMLCGCLSSPELRVADDHFEQKQYAQARVMYNRALRYGLDDKDRQHAQRRRNEIKALEQQAAQARKRKAIERSLQTIGQLPSARDRIDALLWLLTRKNLQANTRAKVMNRLEADFTSMLQSPNLGTWIRALDVHDALSQDSPMGGGKRQETMALALGRRLAGLIRNHNTSEATRWMQHMEQDLRWMQLPNQTTLAKLRTGVAVKLFNATIGTTKDGATQCTRWLNASWSEPNVDKIVRANCQKATIGILSAVDAKADPANPMNTTRLIEAMAEQLPFDATQTLSARRTLNRLAKPWYEKANQANNALVKLFYGSIGDSISGQALSTRFRRQAINGMKALSKPGINYVFRGPRSCRGELSKLRSRYTSDSTSEIRAVLNVSNCQLGYQSKRWTTKTLYRGTNACYTNYATNYKKCGVLNRNVYYRHERVCLVANLSGNVQLSYKGKKIFSDSVPALRRNNCKTYRGWTDKSQLPIKRTKSNSQLSRMRYDYFSKYFSTIRQASRSIQSKIYKKRINSGAAQLKRYINQNTPESLLSAAILASMLQHIRSLNGDPSSIAKRALPITKALRALAPPNTLAYYSTGKTPLIRFKSSAQLNSEKQKRNKVGYRAHVKNLTRKNTTITSRLSKQIKQDSRAPRVSSRWQSPPHVMWRSTGTHVQVERGPVLSMSGYGDSVESLALQVDLGFGPTALARSASPAETLLRGSLALGSLHFHGGYRLGLGEQSRGYTFGLRYIPSPDDGRGRSPSTTLSFGLTYDRLQLDAPDIQDAWSLRASIDYSVPVWDWISLDMRLAPDLFHLLDLAGASEMDAQRAHMATTRLYAGPTVYALRGRFFLHAAMGGAIGKEGTALLWRTEAGFRF